MSGITQRIEARQAQSLVMTPQLQLSLKILQFSNQELSEYIEQEFENNPLLSLEENITQDKISEDSSENGDEINTEIVPENNDYDSGEGILHIEEHSGNKDNGNFYEQIASDEIFLYDHLFDQINIDFADGAEKLIALHLLDMLDDSGYIQIDIAKVAQQLGCNDSAVEDILLDLQKMDPPGIFARSLAECLALQLRDRDRLDPAMQKLLDNLDIMAKRDLIKLQRICEVDREDLLEMCREIKLLDPKPGAKFAHERTQVIHPDIFLRRKNDGSWYVELNNETLPKLIVNRKYYAEVKEKSRDNSDKKFITDNFNTASWLARAVHQRAETILKVSSEIVAEQNEFFEKGIFYLRPMAQKYIAEKVGLHESTIARVVSSKYMSTPRGMFELKYFFSSSIQSVFGEEDISSKAVKQMIYEMIAGEMANNILSDDNLADMLKAKGLNVARRTVAKYRESLNIPSSFKRRQMRRI